MTQQTANSEVGLESPAGTSEVLAFAVLASDAKHFPLYWIKFDPQSTDKQRLIECLTEVLVDPVIETGIVLKGDQFKHLLESFKTKGYRWLAQKQFLPGVTDNLAHTIAEALKLKGIDNAISLASGSGHLLSSDGTSLESAARVQNDAQYKLFHPLVERLFVYDLEGSFDKLSLPGFPDVAVAQVRKPETIELKGLSDADLVKMSKDRLLALSLEEMQAIRDHFEKSEVSTKRAELGLPVSPTDVELEILAQTWSEHCKHKIFNATIEYTEDTAPDTSSRSSTIDSLYKTYIKGATKKLQAQRPDLLSVFEDNSGVVKWNDDVAVCFKVETHNSPSALEPYGGALTGILGVNRDILGTGLGARPIFNTDIFCFAHPDSELADRPKMLPPEAIPSGVRKGVQDGGNKSGIPTVNGAIFFHDGYRAKPLVFCGTGGLLPIKKDGVLMYEKHTKPGDRVIMVGGRVGKDGIHGATFSSESMHEGSPVTAVQIGDPFTQKRVIDFVLAARDKGLISGITDNGAGGLSSSVGEMATITGGATIDVALVPLKYPGLDDWQIVVSESQERMTISTSRAAELTKLAEAYNVEVTDIGEFHNRGCFEVRRQGELVALLDLDFLHYGVPRLNLKAAWYPCGIDQSAKSPLTTRRLLHIAKSKTQGSANHNPHLLALLSHPNIASKEFVIRQYDHEVQGGSVVKPLMGKNQKAPCDAAVIKPIYGQPEGLVVSNGICPQWSEHDPYIMAVGAVDEAVRNAVVVGADPDTICLLDNFCWPDPIQSDRNTDGEYKLGQLVRTCKGLYDACIAYGAPLISGKDSMKNDFDDGVVRLCIPPTLLVSAIGKTPDATKCVTMQFKNPGDTILLLRSGTTSITGSHYESLFGCLDGKREMPKLDLARAAQMYRTIYQAIQKGLINSAHDLSEGGLAVALAECCIGSGLGADVQTDVALFDEGPGEILITVPEEKLMDWMDLTDESEFNIITLGTVSQRDQLKVIEPGASSPSIDVYVPELLGAWTSPLPFD